MSKNDPDKSLSNLLADWKVAPSTDTHFRQNVWARIGQRRTESAWPSYLRSHAAAAASLAILAAIAGGVTGFAQAREQAQEHRKLMAAAYVQSIDVSAMLDQR